MPTWTAPVDTRTAGYLVTSTDWDTLQDNLTVLREPAVVQAGMYRAFAYTQPNTSITIVPFDTVSYGGTFLTTGASANFTCPVAGMYLVTTVVSFTPTDTDKYLLEVFRNGANALVLDQLDSGASVGPITLSGSEQVVCAASDTLDIRFQTANAATSVFTVGEASTRARFALLAQS